MRIVYFLLIIITALLTSCGGAKKIQYFQGTIDTSKYSTIRYSEPVIQAGDMLSIGIFSDNPEASALYNRPVSSGRLTGTSSINGSTTASDGYLVDNVGDVQIHGLGKISARGLTKEELANRISDSLRKVLKNPYCIVKFTNYKITVLGEVARPSVYSVPTEKISILEAIGLAGDLSSFGRRDSVMIIREIGNERKFGWVDLRKPEIFSSDFFYLQQNDVVLVHPTKNKAAADDQVIVRNISLGATLLSTLAVVYSLLTR